MTATAAIKSTPVVSTPKQPVPAHVKRVKALRRFAMSITALNILGHVFLGFEQPIILPFVSIFTAYTLEIFFELLNSWTKGTKPAFVGSVQTFVDFLLPAHIAGLASAMLLYTNEHVLPVMFAVSVAIGSKYIFRAPVGNSTRHFFNPSNLGIAVTLLLMSSSVAFVPPYHFTENISGIFDFLLPLAVITLGSMLNSKLTEKMPLIMAWLGGFMLQGVVRSLLFGAPLLATWMPMTGFAFILYTFYMITDPGTTPSKPKWQIVFGLSVAAVYSLLVTLHSVYGMFFALTIVSGLRGVVLYATALRQRQKAAVPDLQAAVSTAP